MNWRLKTDGESPFIEKYLERVYYALKK